ncbi:MAG: YihY/virulence factor BrkB family protein [Cumulibacter sp.]
MATQQVAERGPKTTATNAVGVRRPTPMTKGQLRRAAWRNGFKRAIHEFGRHGCTDLAAGLTYYSVLSIFPALLAVLSILGVVSSGESTTNAVVDLVDRFGTGGMGETLKPIIVQLTESRGAGLTLVVGVLGALLSASAYVRGFGRAMNSIYEVEEGRASIGLRVIMYVVTMVMVVGAAFVVFSAVMSGSLAREIGDAINLGQEAVDTWNIVKLPVILFVVILMVALLYYVTPNVRQPRFRWLSLGAAIALLIWSAASVGLVFYVSNFGNYNKTYGSLAGVIVFLLWLWLTNLALLFGGVVDAEVVRARQLQAGIKAEKKIQLEPRGTSVSEKQAAARRDVIASSRELRQDSDIRARAIARRRARAAERS